MATNSDWKNVPGFPGYFVTNAGAILGPSRNVLKPMASEDGHLYILIPKARKITVRKLFIHRAVLLAFVGPCPEGMECRHLDGDPSNNVVDNLAWGTQLENAADRVRHGRAPRGEQSKTAKLTEKQVFEIKRRVGFETLRQLGAEYGVSHTAIRRAALGIKWRHLCER